MISKVVAILSLLVSASSFTQNGVVRLRRTDSVLKGSFDNEIGAQVLSVLMNVILFTLGVCCKGFWDPLGLLKDADQARFRRLRYVETKHGRIAMLAILGHIVTSAGIRLPGDIAFGIPFSSVKSGLAAFSTIPPLGIAQIFLFIGLLELGFGARQTEIEAAQLKASRWDKATIDRKLAIELNNGRAAQMGILGLMVHEKLNNDPYVLNSLFGYPVPFNQ